MKWIRNIGVEHLYAIRDIPAPLFLYGLTIKIFFVTTRPKYHYQFSLKHIIYKA
jgi:hypothetical protein